MKYYENKVAKRGFSSFGNFTISTIRLLTMKRNLIISQLLAIKEYKVHMTKTSEKFKKTQVQSLLEMIYLTLLSFFFKMSPSIFQ